MPPPWYGGGVSSPRVPGCRYDVDLTWYYRDSEGAVGHRAQSYEPTTISIGQAPDGLSDRVVAAAGRERRIRGILIGIGRRHEQLLRAAYALPHPRIARLDAELYGELAGVVCLLCGQAVAEGSLRGGARVAMAERVRVAAVRVRAAQAAYAVVARER